MIEAYYDDDIPAQNARVEVVDSQGTIAASGRTDDRGVLLIQKPPPGTYTVKVDAGAGHRTSKNMSIQREEQEATSPRDRNAASPQIVSEGQSREETTQTPWMKIGLGLAVILFVCGLLWIFSTRGKN